MRDLITVYELICELTRYPANTKVLTFFGNSGVRVIAQQGGAVLIGHGMSRTTAWHDVTIPYRDRNDQNMSWADYQVQQQADHLEWLLGMKLVIDRDYTLDMDNADNVMIYRFVEEPVAVLFKIRFL